MSELNQLLLRFDQKQNFTYNDYYVSKSNFFAFKLIDSWPKWEKNIINIYGEEGCGKSHLAKIFKAKNKALKLNEAQLNNEKLSLIKPYENVILDNFTKNTDENVLYSLFNMVNQDNKFLKNFREKNFDVDISNEVWLIK